MVKKTLLSLAIAATTLSLAGCNLSTTDKYDNKITNTPPPAPAVTVSGTHIVFSAAQSDIPLANDIVFANAATTDGTAHSDGKASPVVAALNKLAGFSTLAPIYIKTTGEVDISTAGSVTLVKLKNTPAYTKQALTTAVNALSAEDKKKVLGDKETVPDFDVLDLTTILLYNMPHDDGVPTISFNAAGSFDTLPVVGAVSDVNVDTLQLNSLSDKYLGMFGDTIAPDATHAIRIAPTKPLDPKTKYLVILTNKIVDAEDNPVTGSYEYETVSGNGALPSPALAPVRTAVQGWENLAASVLSGGDLTKFAAAKSSIVLTYAFTTDASLDVLETYAAPAKYVQNIVPQAQAEALTDNVVKGQLLAAVPLPAESDPSYATVAGLRSAINSTTDYIARLGYLRISKGANWFPSNAQEIQELVGATTGAAVSNVKASATYLPGLYATIASSDISSLVGAESAITVNGAVNAAKPRDVAKYSVSVPAAAVNPSFPATVGITQGVISLPDFLGVSSSTSMASDPTFAASDAMGSILKGVQTALGQTARDLPPKDKDGVSTNVTYRFPFAKQVGTNQAPYLLVKPDTDCSKPSAGYPVVIYVHGITSNRGSGLPLGIQLAANDVTRCIATVAIDLPLHGIAPKDQALKSFILDSTWTNSGSQWASATPDAWTNSASTAGTSTVAPRERHYGVWQNDFSVRGVMDLSGTEASSGSTFINLQNFARTHDALRQAVMDLLNLNASLKNIDSDLDLNNVYVVGHSLGGIVASAFVAANNNSDVQNLAGYNAQLRPNGLPKVQKLLVAGSGGHLTKLLENSPSFSPVITSGLFGSAKLLPSADDYEKFLTVFQSLLDGVDPANTLKKINTTTTPVIAVGVTNDMTVPNDDYFKDTSNLTVQNFVNVNDVSTSCFTQRLGALKNQNFSAFNTNCLSSGKIAIPAASWDTAAAPIAGGQVFTAVNNGVTVNSLLDAPSNPYDGHAALMDPTKNSGATFTSLVTAVIGMIAN